MEVLVREAMHRMGSIWEHQLSGEIYKLVGSRKGPKGEFVNLSLSNGQHRLEMRLREFEAYMALVTAERVRQLKHAVFTMRDSINHVVEEVRP